VSHGEILLALALGTFAVGTESFMIAAILPAIASSVRVGVLNWALMGARVLLAIAAGLYVPPPLTIASARPRRDGCTIVPANALRSGPIAAEAELPYDQGLRQMPKIRQLLMPSASRS
jgi:hypothetical protein